MTTQHKNLIDSYIYALIKDEESTNIKGILTEKDKPYFREQYLLNLEAINIQATKKDVIAQKEFDEIFIQLAVAH